MTSKIFFFGFASIATACILVLSSCMQTFSLSDANKVRKGMTKKEVKSQVAGSPVKDFQISITSDPNATFNVMYYIVQMGGSVFSDYYLVFENDKLLYWGQPYEFLRHPDTKLNEIGVAAANR